MLANLLVIISFFTFSVQASQELLLAPFLAFLYGYGAYLFSIFFYKYWKLDISFLLSTYKKKLFLYLIKLNFSKQIFERFSYTINLMNPIPRESDRKNKMEVEPHVFFLDASFYNLNFVIFNEAWYDNKFARKGKYSYDELMGHIYEDFYDYLLDSIINNYFYKLYIELVRVQLFFLKQRLTRLLHNPLRRVLILTTSTFSRIRTNKFNFILSRNTKSRRIKVGNNSKRAVKNYNTVFFRKFSSLAQDRIPRQKEESFEVEKKNFD